MEPVKGKVATLLEMFATGKEYTLEEMVAGSGVSMGTAKMQVAYLLKKNGYTVTKRIDESNVAHYTVTK